MTSVAPPRLATALGFETEGGQELQLPLHRRRQPFDHRGMIVDGPWDGDPQSFQHLDANAQHLGRQA